MPTRMPEVYNDGPDFSALFATSAEMLDHQKMHSVLLAGIHKQLAETPVAFRIQVPAGPTGNLGTPVMSAAQGEILTLQNPTAAPITIDLFENDGGNTVLRVTVAANSFQALFIPFFGRLFARSGAGMILAGHVSSA